MRFVAVVKAGHGESGRIGRAVVRPAFAALFGRLLAESPGAPFGFLRHALQRSGGAHA